MFLELNGLDASEIANDDVYDLVIWIASASPTLDEITSRFAQLLDSYVKDRGLESGSAAVHKAVRLLRASKLGSAYEAAWADWEGSEDAELWDGVAADGVR